MSKTIVRLHYKMADGTIMDVANEYELSDFACVTECGRSDARSGHEGCEGSGSAKKPRTAHDREQGFQPRDNKNYVALICESRPLSAAESALES